MAQHSSSSPKVWHKGLISQLEPRLMYDGAAAVVAAEVVATIDADSTTEAQEAVEIEKIPVATEQGPSEENDASGQVSDVTAADVMAALETEDSTASDQADTTIENAASEENGADELLDATKDDATQDSAGEVAFIDASVQDAEILAAGIDPSIEIYYLDADSSGLSQMAEILNGREDIDAIHVFSHGSSGDITLGSQHLTSENITEQADDLTEIAKALENDADILIYGCNVGMDTAFLSQLSELTGADVSASNDTTGSNDLGGNWMLEVDIGAIETDSIRVENYENVFATTLINGLGGTAGFGENTFAGNDDGATGSIDLTSVFGVSGVRFGDTYYTEMYINNNGVVNFGSATTSYTPNGLSTGIDGTPGLAIYWTDLDTRFGAVTASSGGTSQGTNLVHWDIDIVNERIIVTWDDVGEFNTGSTTKIAAQVVLENAGSGDIDFSFRYEYATILDTHNVTAGWNVGVSGGTEGVDYYEISNGSGLSGTSALSDLDIREGNTGVVGLWEFSLRDGGVSDAGDTEFSSIGEDVVTNNGEIVSTIFGDNIAVTAVDDTHGDWQYSLNGGSSWISFSATSGASVDILNTAILLDSSAYIRFQADENWHGDTSLDYKVWSGSGGSSGGTLDAAISGEVSGSAAIASLEVTSVNDAPIITNGPDSVSLTETDGALSTAGSLTVTDVDTADEVTASVDSVSSVGNTGSLTNGQLQSMLSVTPTAVLDGSTSSASFTWSFDSGSEVFDFLQSTDTLTLTYMLMVEDNNSTPLSDTETVTITITGTNDAPVIADGPDAVALNESNVALSTSGSLTVTDVDTSDVVTASHSLSVGGSSDRSDVAAPSDANLLAMLTLTPTAILNGTENSASLGWSFDSGAEAFDYLATGETLILTYTVQATDDDGTPASDSETVTITITGTNELPSVVATTSDDISELTDGSAQNLNDTGTVTFADIDTTDVIGITYVSNNNISWSGGTIDSALAAKLEAGFSTGVTDAAAPGTTGWSYNVADANLDFVANGETITYSYTITATDNNGGQDTATVSFVITGTNDSPTVSASSTTIVTELADGSGQDVNDSGSVTFGDVDATDVIDISYVSNMDISWSGGTIDSALADKLVAGFSTGVIDADAPGTTPWTYDVTDVDLDFIAETETVTYSYTVTATDKNGATDTAVVFFTITSTNDIPVISVEQGDSNESSVTETNGGLATSGTLSVQDLDTTDVLTVTATVLAEQQKVGGNVMGSDSDEPNNGELSSMFNFTSHPVDGTGQSGTISWDFDSNSENFNYLAKGEKLVLVYTLTVTDSRGDTDTQDVTVTVVGTNDTPDFSSLASPADGKVAESFSYSIPNFTDVDTTDSISYSVTGLPAGLSFSSGAMNITGTPTEAGIFTITVTAKDSSGASIKSSFSLTVQPQPVIVVSDSVVLPPPTPPPEATQPGYEGNSPEIVIPVMDGVDVLGDDSSGDGFGSEEPAMDTALPETESNETPATGSTGTDVPPEAVNGNQEGGNGEQNSEILLSREVVRVDSSGQVQFVEQGDKNSAVSLSVESLEINPDSGAVVLKLYTSSESTISNYTTTLADGSPLPQWLTFDPIQGTISGQPPEGMKTLDLNIEVTNADGKMEVLQVTIQFEQNEEEIEIQSGEGILENTDETTTKIIGLRPLSTQLVDAGQVADTYGAELLEALA